MAKRIAPIIGIFVVVGLVIGARSVWPDTSQATAGPDAEQTNKTPAAEAVPVVLTPVRQMVFEHRLVVSGNVQAKNEALVSARLPGPLDAVFVDEGDAVVAGKTKLFQTDALKLTKAVAVARQGLVVAEASMREKQARMEQAVADKQQVERDAGRFQQLAAQNAIPLQQAEQYGARLKQAVAAVKDVQALIELSEAQVAQARLSLAIAEKDLADSTVVAPISGWVSERRSEPGEMAGMGEPVLKVEDTSILEISVFLPEQYYDQVVVRRTKMKIAVGAHDLEARPVSYRSPVVRSKLRTFEARAVIVNPPTGVVPGRLAQVTVVLATQTALGVPTGAIQRRNGNTVIFRVKDGKAVMVPVATSGEMDGMTAVTSTELDAKSQVLTMGQNLVEDGTSVTVVERAQP